MPEMSLPEDSAADQPTPADLPSPHGPRSGDGPRASEGTGDGAGVVDPAVVEPDERRQTDRRTPAVVFATVGTDQHPFDRIVRWIDRVAAGRPDVQCVIQYGASVKPTFASGVDYLNHGQLLSWIDRAAVVITHGGPASIIQVRERHGRPIVVPRDPERGEHVDRHQLDFAGMLARMDAISLASSAEELDRLVQEHLERPPTPLSSLSGAPVGVAGFSRHVNPLLNARAPRRTR